MSKRKWSFAAVAAAILLMGVTWLDSAAALPEPTPTEIATARSVWQLMGDERFAYLIRNKDEKLALKVVDTYLIALDPQRIVFLSKDIEKFQRKPMWALAAMQGRAMAAPLRVHEIFEQRANERQEWLKQWKPSSDYKKGATWEANRKEAPWPTSATEQDALWQRYMDYTYMVSETYDRTSEKVIKLQSDRLRRVSALPRAEIVEAFVNSFAQTIDPHAAYMTPRSAEDMMITLSHSLDGVGAILSDRDGGIFVEEVVAGGPAHKSGKIAVGDRIIAISQGEGDWKDVASMRSQDAVGLIRGKVGTTVRIRLAKAGNATVLEDVSLQRQRIILTESGAKEKIIQSKDSAIGWIKLPGFYMDIHQDGKGAASATKDVEQALERLKKANIDGVVLDLRDNGGGSLTEAVDLVGLFLPPSDVVQILGSDERITQLKSTRQTPVWSGPLVVLVNNGSASASEIAAGALQDHGRAIIVGEKTFGKGTVQSIIDLDRLWNNSSPLLGQMKMTVAQFFLPSGNSTQLRGVSPDIEILATLNDVPGEDQYENAAPAATIPSVKGLSRGEWSGHLGKLKQGVQTRAATSSEFLSWVKLRQQVHQKAGRKGFPLNAQEADTMKTADDQWSRRTTAELKELNMDREAKGVDPVAKIAAGVASDWIALDASKM